MNYIFTPSTVEGQTTEIISLQILKEYLRVTHEAENNKIQDIANSAIQYWENTTGYLLRNGSLELTFNYRDASNYDRRQEHSFARIYDDRSYYGNTGYYSNQIRYYPTVGANIESQRPTSFSFNDPDDNQQIATNEELMTLPDNFFFVFNKLTLEFMLKIDSSNTPDFLTEKRFSQFAFTPIKLTVAVQAWNPMNVDIKQCILRIASGLYEKPDSGFNFTEDSFIENVISQYNCNPSL